MNEARTVRRGFGLTGRRDRGIRPVHQGDNRAAGGTDMRAGAGLLVAAIVATLTGAGCCRLCHRWCDDRDDCRRHYAPRDCGCYCAPPPRYSPDCECGPGEDRLPPPSPRYDTRPARYADDPPPRREARPDDRPTGDPRYDRAPARQTGAYGGTGN